MIIAAILVCVAFAVHKQKQHIRGRTENSRTGLEADVLHESVKGGSNHSEAGLRGFLPMVNVTVLSVSRPLPKLTSPDFKLAAT